MSIATFKFKSELRGLLALGLPIILTQLIQVSNTTVAILMMGRVGSIELAAVGLGGAFMIFVFLACLGVMMSLSPTIAQHFGAGRNDSIRHAFQQGLWLAVGTGAGAFFLLRQMGRLMHWMAVDPEVIPLAQAYLDIAAWSMPSVCIYMAFRFLCEATGHSRPMLVVNIATLPAVVAGNWALIFGHWGFPTLGVEGAAFNLILVMMLNALGLVLFVLVSERYRVRRLFSLFQWPSRECFILLKLGLPIAGTLVLDAGFFSAIALLMGKMGYVWLAAHQVAINYATVAFMIPVSLSSATMARVGQAVGQGDWVLARARGFLGISSSLLLVLPSIILVLAVPQWIAHLYTGDVAVIEAAVPLLMVAAVLHIFDATYITAQGALRGLKDVNGPMLISLSFWLCGLPAAWFFGIVNDWGAVGLWWGMIVGVALTAVLLLWRFHWRSGSMILAKTG